MNRIKPLLAASLALALLGCQFLPGGTPADPAPAVEEAGETAEIVVEPTTVVVVEEAAPTDEPTQEVIPTNTPEPIPPTSTPVPEEAAAEDADESESVEDAEAASEEASSEGEAEEPAESESDESVTGETVDALVGEKGAQFFEEAGSATTMRTTLPVGDPVKILGISSNEYWYEVETVEGVGWIPTSQIDVENTDALENVKKYSAKLSANLSSKVRVEPNRSSPVYTSLEENEEAEILGVNGDSTWYQIQTDDGKIGWVSASIVTVSGNGKGIARFNPRSSLSSSAAASGNSGGQAAAPAQPAPTQAPAASNSGGQAAAPAPTAAPAQQSSAAAPPAAPRPGDLYYSTDNGAFAGAGRISQGAGNAQRGGCRGMTWTVLHQLDGITHVGSDLRTNPYAGDATCDQSYPVLCIFKSGGGPPASSRPDLELNYYKSWAGAQVLSTGVVNGHQMPTLDAANKICADTFGSQYWQIAEFHDGNFGQGGWELWANGTLPLGTRFWVSIDDQRANPWNSQ